MNKYFYFDRFDGRRKTFKYKYLFCGKPTSDHCKDEKQKNL